MQIAAPWGRGFPGRRRREEATEERGNLTTMRKACLGSRQCAQTYDMGRMGEV